MPRRMREQAEYYWHWEVVTSIVHEVSAKPMALSLHEDTIRSKVSAQGHLRLELQRSLKMMI